MPERPDRTIWLPDGTRHQVLKPSMRFGSVPGLGPIEPPSRDPTVEEMRKNREVTSRKAAALERLASQGRGPMTHTGSISSSQVSLATSKPVDPMFYWRENNLPYLYTEEAGARNIRNYANLIYQTHPVIASCIDIYSIWPLTGMRLSSKDKKVEEFESELYLETLNYPDYLSSILKQVWMRGEAFPLGQFDETLGIWEDDQLIDPDTVKVIDSPFFKESRFEMRIPEAIREIVNKREPEWEFRQLVKGYPEIVHHAQVGDYIPVDSTLMRHIALKSDDFHPRGISILLRAFRAIRQEEMLNAAVDAVASRLYTPLILVRLGATAQDMGTDVAWVPTPDELEEFEATLDMALLADFRVLTSSFATQIDSVFGKEIMPNWGDDYDRLMDRQLMAFGLSRTLLNGASDGQTYAADALNKQLVGQLLGRAQRWIKRFFKQRAMVVAEAREHFDYEEVAGHKRVIYHDVKEVDEESGQVRIVRKPKLLTSTMEFDVLDLNDKETMRQFIEQLRGTGVPVSMQTRLYNVPWVNLEDEWGKFHDEQVRMAVETASVRADVYMALKAEGRPIPEDLRRDFDPKAQVDLHSPEIPGSGPDSPLPNMAIQPVSGTNLAPTPEDYAAAEAEGTIAPDAAPGTVPFPMGAPLTLVPGGQPQRPPESDEMRQGMPRASRQQRPSRSQREASTGTSGRAERTAAALRRRETIGYGIYDVDEDDE